MINENVKSCLLCGVGGQGTVLASRIIAAAAMEKGLRAKTAETIGMAQRGGSVVSHVRTGRNIASPMIPYGRADILIGFEPGEAVVNLKYLKPGGTLIVCEQEVKPVTASLGQSAYSGEDCIQYLKKTVEKCYVIDGEAICEACGSPKVLNVAVVGALCASGEMELSLEEVEAALKIKLKPRLVEMNRKALRMGAMYIK
ncbi:indolepyruvate oxidoreductase subunit beta [bacterium 210820-DFI.6.37]|nr:indolepyruvate oxidoreductase subunit beta [bacterium 210820-DFI.6.37]